MANSFWKRAGSRVYHEFTEHARWGMNGELVTCESLCERHSISLDTRSVTLYHPWMGDDFPPDSVMCKGCIKARGASDGPA